MKFFYFIPFLLILFSCNSEEKVEVITHKEDYNDYLDSTINSSFESSLSEKDFWSKRLRKDSSGIGEIRPLANAYLRMYENSGEASYLKNAEQLYKKGILFSAHNKDAYQRDLINVLINQGLFQEAKKILVEENFKTNSNKRVNQYVFFDVYMKLEEFQKADELLKKIANQNDYNYLIRLAKRNIQQKNSEAAIRNLKSAMKIADTRKSKPLQVLIYNSLADLYLKLENYNDAYALSLKTLHLQPDNVSAKYQIAHIVFYHDKNAKEANRIMEAVLMNYKSSEFLIFKEEIKKIYKE